jgi:membrane protein
LAATSKEITQRINQFVANIHSGTLGATGMVALVFVAIGMLSRIEDTFNDIWGVTRGRGLFTRIIQYWAAITLGPLLLVVALVLTGGPHLQATRVFLESLPWIGAGLVKVMMGLLPFALLTLAFAVFYHVMPHTRVHWNAALVGGLVGGCLWQLNNEFSVLYVSRVVSNSRIYGSLGMVPVFMIGLYFSWIILLFGAQVAYTYQNRQAYLQGRLAERINQRGREFIALRLMVLIALTFRRGEPPPRLSRLAELLAVPSRLAGQILDALAQSQLVRELADAEPAYSPARPLSQITLQDILHAMRTGLASELATRDDAARALVRREFDRVSEAERQAAAATTLQDLVQELESSDARQAAS